MARTIWRRVPTAGDVFDVALNMRDSDAAEIFASRRDDDRRRFAAETAAALPHAPMALAYGLDGSPKPCALLWVWPLDESGALASVNLFATSDFPRLAGALVRDLRTRLGPMLVAAGFRRLECRVLETHTQSRRFIRHAGGAEEGACRAFGRNNETFILCAWLRSEWENR